MWDYDENGGGGGVDLYSLPSHVICRFLFVSPLTRFRVRDWNFLFKTIWIFFSFVCFRFVLTFEADEKRDNRERKEIEIELTTPVNCVRTRVSLCKKQNDVRVLNDVVCLTICVGIYEQQERERTREDKFIYIIYIYRDAIQSLFWVKRILSCIYFISNWMDGW